MRPHPLFGAFGAFVGLLTPALKKTVRRLTILRVFVLRNCGNTPKPQRHRATRTGVYRTRGGCELRHLAHCQRTAGALSMVPQTGDVIRTSRARSPTKARSSQPIWFVVR